MRRALIAMLLLSGCAAPRLATQVTQVRAASLGLDADTPRVDAEWWRLMGDPQLDRLIAAGLAGNPSLDSALARLREAQAAVDARHAGLEPQVSADGQALYERLSGRSIIPPPYGGSRRWVPQVQANLSWTLDLFGRQHALVAQARGTAAAAGYDAAAARLAIATGIAQAYIGLARADRLIAVADGFVRTRGEAVAYVRSRIRNRLASELDAKAAETLLAEARQARVRAVAARDLLIHALAAMTGRGADGYPEIAPPTLALDRAPAVPAVLPADLLGRRPDLLAGRARIDAAAAGRQAARAAYLPDVDITALAGLAAIGLGPFFSAAASQYGAGAALHLPIFEGGRLRADFTGATATLDQAVADYDDAVLGAVRDTADAVTNVRAADADLGAQAIVVRGLRDTVSLNEVRLKAGLDSRLDTIDSGFRLLEAEQALVGLQADALTRRIQLVAALGGGFDPSAVTARAAAPAPEPHS